tara:strand:- start:4559 stop:5758 length:1200 start_codon:yes stop_codon:yes gene_type:complete
MTTNRALLTTLLLLSSTTPSLCMVSEPQESMHLGKHTLRDPGNQNMESHTVLVPEGWTLEGGVTWTPENAIAYVHVDATVAGPDGHAVEYHPNGSYTYFETSLQFPQPEIGATVEGKTFLSPSETPREYVRNTLLPAARPKARHAKVTRVREVKEVRQVWEDLLGPMIREQEQMNAMNAFTGLTMQVKTTIAAPRIRVRYTENGTQFEEDFVFLMFRMDSVYDDGWSYFRSTDWSVFDVRSARAPKGKLDDSLPLLTTIANSLKPTRRWQAMIDELNAYILKLRQKTHEITMREIRKRSAIIAKQGDDWLESHNESWKKSQQSNDRLNRAWSNTMHGVDDYELPDGSVESLDSGYENVYTDNGGNFLFTNDHLNDPNVGSTIEWTRIEPIAPMGGAANR